MSFVELCSSVRGGKSVKVKKRSLMQCEKDDGEYFPGNPECHDTGVLCM